MDPIAAHRAAAAAERLPRAFRTTELLLRLGGVDALLGLTAAQWRAVGLPAAAWQAREGSPVAPSAPVAALGWEEMGYPAGLRRLCSAPPVLFVRGSAPLPEAARCVALIGARRCTELGRSFARDLARGLAKAGVVVVSGMALGIDAAAHEGALDGGGTTLAVLASPVDQPTPRTNLALANEVLEEGGWLVSERPFGSQVRAHDFPRRNRLVPALCAAVVVVEADLRSGTLSTVAQALDLGVPVGAVPGPPCSPASRGSNALIRSGAHLVDSAGDVLRLIGRASMPGAAAGFTLEASEEALLNGLPGASGAEGDWLHGSGLEPVVARSALWRLLARGGLRRLPGGRIARVL